MITRAYYIPRNAFGRNVMNVIVQKVECSIGDFKRNQETDTIRFSITCRACDMAIVERILKRYDLL